MILNQTLGDAAASEEFDPVWYAKTYPDVALTGIGPAEHYEWIGRRIGRKPNGRHEPPAESEKSEAPKVVLAPPPIASGSAGEGIPKMPLDPDRWALNSVRIARQRSLPLKPLTQTFNPDAMNLHWIISGELPLSAHQSQVLALVRELDQRGHNQWVWIQPPCDQDGEAGFKAAMATEGVLAPRTIVRVLPEHVSGISGDAIIATSWKSSLPAAAMPLFKARFRFLHRLDENGSSDGTEAAIATYAASIDMMTLCLSPQLESCKTRFSDWVQDLPLFADERVFYTASQPAPYQADAPFKIAVDMGAGGSQGVATELTLDVLEILADRGLVFTAHLFGQKRTYADKSRSYTNCERLSAGERGELFRSCHVGLSLATGGDCTTSTEMSACGLANVNLAASEAFYLNKDLQSAAGLSVEIADSIASIVAKLANAGQGESLSVMPVRTAAIAAEAALREGLSANNVPVRVADAMATADYEHKAAVIIPTWNGGALFRDVLDAVTSQSTPWSFDVLVVDSGSTDETLEIVESFASRGVRLHTIPNSQFQHGRTRNLAISLTSAEFVAVLTQDATPTNAFWLANLVAAFDLGDKVAGVFGAHEAYPDATPYVTKGISGHFDHFNRLPHVAEWRAATVEPISFGSVAWQNWAHYYSDNNSCMRRSVWEKIPYPDIDWGEDQVWAWEIFKQGYQKAYANDAVVYHSHNLNADQQRKVSSIEGKFWIQFFNYSFESDKAELDASLEYLRSQRHDFALANGVDNSVRDEQILLDRESLVARYTGQAQFLHELYNFAG